MPITVCYHGGPIDLKSVVLDKRNALKAINEYPLGNMLGLWIWHRSEQEPSTYYFYRRRDKADPDMPVFDYDFLLHQKETLSLTQRIARMSIDEVRDRWEITRMAKSTVKHVPRNVYVADVARLMNEIDALRKERDTLAAYFAAQQSAVIFTEIPPETTVKVDCCPPPELN